ncbi:MAG: (d)CMP kinase [Planctomycetota bacterium]|jgi:cytidylate kinase
MADRVVIAIDGPSGSGKSTVARLLAMRIGFRFLDSGSMYRAVSLLALREGVGPEEEARLGELAGACRIELLGETVKLDGEDVSREIRSPEVTRFVSRVAAVRAVRASMVAKQRAAHPGEGLVAEGRDIGSVVFPDADLKVFLTARPEERARRRALETGRGLEEVLAEQKERDARDAGRRHSPLVRAPDAVELDTTGLSIEEVTDRLAEMARPRLSG